MSHQSYASQPEETVHIVTAGYAVLLKCKRCKVCGAVHNAESWSKLKYIGAIIDTVLTLELRNCYCGSTLTAPAAFHDPDHLDCQASQADWDHDYSPSTLRCVKCGERHAMPALP